MVSFVIPGRPVPKQRPRMGKNGGTFGDIPPTHLREVCPLTYKPRKKAGNTSSPLAGGDGRRLKTPTTAR